MAGLLLFIGLWQISEPRVLFSDFYKAYYAAADRVWQSGAVPTWPQDASCIEGFVNLPILAWAFVPLLALGRTGAGWAFFGLSAGAMLGTWALLARLGRLDAKAKAWLLFLFLVNGPAINSLREGNTTGLVLLLLVLALLLWRAERDFAAGILLGLCGLIKLPLLIYGGYFLLRGRWRVVAGGVATTGGALLLSMAVFGVPITGEWYGTCVVPFAGQVMPAFNVQSVDGFLARLSGGAEHLLDWRLYAPEGVHKLVRLPLLASLAAAAFYVVIAAQRRESEPRITGALSARDLLEFGLVLTLALVASPVSWSHYYLLLLLPYALCLGGLLPIAGGSGTHRLMTVGFVLSSLPVVVLPLGEGLLSQLASRSVVSLCLFGGVLMLGASMRAAWPPRQPGTALLGGAVLGVAAFFAFNALVVNGLLAALTPAPFDETVIRHTLELLAGRSGDDSWEPMWRALQYFELGYIPGRTPPIYSEVFFTQGVKFQYPPTALLLVAWMREAHAVLGQWVSVKDLVAWVFILVTLVATARSLEQRWPCGEADGDAQTARMARVALVAAFTLTFYPVVKAYSLGQIQVWINGLFALALLAWLRGGKTMAGACIGLVCLVKPHFVVFLVWGLLRGQWRFVAAVALTVALGLALSLSTFGWLNHVDYVRVLAHVAERGEAYYPNQSINGLLNRLASITEPILYNNLEWVGGRFPPFNPWVYWGTFVGSGVILVAALLGRRPHEDKQRIIDFCTIAVSCTIASPVAWEHHYGVLLPVFAVVLPAVLRERRQFLWLAASFVLVSNYIPATNLLAGSLLNVVQSYLLAGAMILLGLLYWLQAPAAWVALREAAQRTAARRGWGR